MCTNLTGDEIRAFMDKHQKNKHRVNSKIKNGVFPDEVLPSIFAKIRAAEAQDKAQKTVTQ
jgi:hypothetical protein